MENSIAEGRPELACEWSERNLPLMFSYGIAKNIKTLLTISRYRDILKAKGDGKMPVLSRFYGIIIRMYFLQKEHNPPHIHAIYGENVAAITIADGKVLEGDLPAKALEMVREWLSEHREELLSIWETQEFRQIPPLE